jgi:hypothetical protein
MSNPRYLTKSRFKLAMECPTKLFYTAKKDYANQKLSDPFLAALADGGFQVGRLAQCYFPGGTEIETRDYDEAIRQTEELLAQESVIIYEAAFRYNNFFIRADVVVKKGNDLELIEVKAKSCDFADESGCWNKNATISATWLPYIQDVAFQKYVVEHAHPELKVTAHLMLSDKTVLCATDGLNQKFRLVTGTDGQRRVEVSPDLSDADLATPILRKICVDVSCEKVYAGAEDRSQNSEVSSQPAETRRVGRVSEQSAAEAEPSAYERMLNYFAGHYARDEKIVTPPSAICKDCEFRHGDGDADLKSGFRECWTSAFKWQDADFDEHTVLDLWKFGRKDDLISEGKIKLSAVTLDDIALKGKPKADPPPGFSTTDRQWMQIRKAVDRDHTPHLHADHLKREMDSWTFPLHFIDFETASPVIPFKRGRRPYEGVAFQFSHHTVDADGRVEHRGEYLNAVPGVFPNYDLVRALKIQLQVDRGTIFRYHSHENSYLCAIRDQILRDPEAPADRDDLVSFIETIAKPRGKKEHPDDNWEAGPRNMVDLFEMVLRYYYHPATRGSISLKYVLPAVLSTSEFLQDRYARPIYGAANGIRSLNFKDHQWVVYESEPGAVATGFMSEPGAVATGSPAGTPRPSESADRQPNEFRTPHSAIRTPKDPYRLLPKLFSDESERDYEIIFEHDRITDGGAAMTAYGKLQFQQMSPQERASIESALLKYCELDTLAMVMIYEAWKAELEK